MEKIVFVSKLFNLLFSRKATKIESMSGVFEIGGGNGATGEGIN